MGADWEAELVCDFQSIYHLDWWDQVWTGDPKTVTVLLEGLIHRPDSLWRAAQLAATVSASSDGNMRLSWIGLDQGTAILANLYNLVASYLRQKTHVVMPTSATVDPIDAFWTMMHGTTNST